MDNAVLFNCCTDHAEPAWSMFTKLVLGACKNLSDDPESTWFNSGFDRSEAECFTIFGADQNGDCEPITDIHGTFDEAMLVLVALVRRSHLTWEVDC